MKAFAILALLIASPVLAQTEAKSGASLPQPANPSTTAPSAEDRTGQAPIGEADAQHSLAAQSPLLKESPNQIAARTTLPKSQPAPRRCRRAVSRCA